MPEVSLLTRKLIQQEQFCHQALQPKEGVVTIHVDEIASKIASFYEKIRGVVEWREEHLLRKTAIERIFKRRLLLEKNSGFSAEDFIKELIRGGHFANDAIEESKIERVQKLIDKYIFIIENASFSVQQPKPQLHNWLSEIAACEVEETLSPPLKERALIDYMTEMMEEKIQVDPKLGMEKEEISIQIYVAVQRALFRLDPSIIGYHLLLKKFATWKNLSSSELEQITKNIFQIKTDVEKSINHPLAGKFYKVAERYDTPYLILGDVISENPNRAPEILSSPDEFEKKIQEFYQNRLRKLKSRMARAGLFSVISIFVTKILLAFALEIPFDRYIIYHPFNTLSMGLNVAVPPLLMLFLILTIRPPSKSNLQRVIMEVMKITYKTEKKETYAVKPFEKRGPVLNTIITFLYMLCFVVTFGAIIWGFKELNKLSMFEFSEFSQGIFIVFICLISFAGVKVRETAKELTIEEQKETFFQAFTEIFAIPILRMGKWLSTQWLKYNVIVLMLNSLIDMPFQMAVKFLEHWRNFLKERKEEIH